MATKYKIPVVLSETFTGTPIAVGSITAKALADRARVPRRDSRNKTGYQREVSTARVNRLMGDLKKRRVDLPTSILVNLRDFRRDHHLQEGLDGTHLVLEPNDLLYIVDGQHRVEAMRRLLEEDEGRWGDLALPIVAMLGANEREEIKQFYVVNSTAKSVRTDLAYDLLKQRAESEPGVMDSLVETNETWKVRGQQLVEDLERQSPLWKGRVRFPGDSAGSTTIGSSGLVGSLQTLLNTPYFGRLTGQNQVKILDAYWHGIQQVIPEAFGEPTDYALQKSVGVQIMHGLLVTVIEHVRSSGDSVIEPDAYAKVISEALTLLEGDNRAGGVVRGSDFWLAGADGGAGTYSSNAGRRVLTAKIRNLLPELEIE